MVASRPSLILQTEVCVQAQRVPRCGGVRGNCCSRRAQASLRRGQGLSPHRMGNLVVGNYDLNPGHGVSGNAFIYNMSTRKWTLLQLGGSLAAAW